MAEFGTRDAEVHRRFTALFRAWTDKNTSWSVELNAPMISVVLDAIANDASPGALVLDLGCGDGHVTSVLSGEGLRAIGLDASFQAVSRAARRHPGGAFAAGTADRLPLSDGTVDVVYAGSMLQYTDRAASLREIARVLRPGGLLISLENLQGSPVARAARAYLKLTGHRYAPNLTPHVHLRRQDLPLYSQFFASVTSRGFNLLTPMIWVAARPLARWRPWRARAGASRLYARLHEVDRRLLHACPFLERYAWHVVVCARR